MAGQNQYLTFAGSGGANTLTPAAWAALTTLLANGFQSGLASSQQVNTLFRQLTTVAAAIGKLVSDNNQDALDNGDYTGLALAIRNAVSANSGLQSLTVAPSSNTMVVTVQPSTLGFRSSSLGSGAIGNITSTSPLTLTIPQGATLGMSNGQLGRVAVLAINVGGTMELAVANVAGSLPLDEMGVISTTALSASATSATTYYSTAARSSVAYRVLGIFDTTQTTAGTYVTAPSLVQPAGGLALAALAEPGAGQTIQDVTASRSIGTTFFNLTGRSIYVYVTCQFSGSAAAPRLAITTPSGTVTVLGSSAAGSAQWGIVAYRVPQGASYTVTATATMTLQSWIETR